MHKKASETLPDRTIAPPPQGDRWSMSLLRVILVAAAAVATAAPAAGAGFDPHVVTFGSERDQIKSIPIEKRPNRPLHVYGNSIRRRHDRAMQSTPRADVRR